MIKLYCAVTKTRLHVPLDVCEGMPAVACVTLSFKSYNFMYEDSHPILSGGPAYGSERRTIDFCKVHLNCGSCTIIAHALWERRITIQCELGYAAS